VAVALYARHLVLKPGAKKLSQILHNFVTAFPIWYFLLMKELMRWQFLLPLFNIFQLIKVAFVE